MIDLFDNLKGLLTIALILLGCTIVVILIIWFVCFIDYYDERDDNVIIVCKKRLKKLIIWLGISGLLFTAIPSKDTMYTMLVLENVTTDNIQDIGKTGKDMANVLELVGCNWDHMSIHINKKVRTITLSKTFMRDFIPDMFMTPDEFKKFIENKVKDSVVEFTRNATNTLNELNNTINNEIMV